MFQLVVLVQLLGRNRWTVIRQRIQHVIPGNRRIAGKGLASCFITNVFDVGARVSVARLREIGQADAGVAIEAAARAHALAFIPLAVERLDLVLHRRDYFEPPVQALLAFLRMEEFAAQAKALGGYDVAASGRVVFNG